MSSWPQACNHSGRQLAPAPSSSIASFYSHFSSNVVRSDSPVSCLLDLGREWKSLHSVSWLASRRTKRVSLYDKNRIPAFWVFWWIFNHSSPVFYFPIGAAAGRIETWRKKWCYSTKLPRKWTFQFHAHLAIDFESAQYRWNSHGPRFCSVFVGDLGSTSVPNHQIFAKTEKNRLLCEHFRWKITGLDARTSFTKWSRCFSCCAFLSTLSIRLRSFRICS